VTGQLGSMLRQLGAQSVLMQHFSPRCTSLGWNVRVRSKAGA
jgi:hypothetical protein